MLLYVVMQRYVTAVRLTWMPTKKQVMTTCDLGLISPGLRADLEAESKILEILFVLVSKAP